MYNISNPAQQAMGGALGATATAPVLGMGPVGWTIAGGVAGIASYLLS